MIQSVELHRMLIERKTFFCYSGPMTERVLSAISDAVKSKLADTNAEGGTAKKVFGVFVEQAQNIIRYSSEVVDVDDEINRIGTVAISQTVDGFLIEAINVIDADKVDSLNGNLMKLKNMDSSELKNAYRQRLKDGPPVGSSGAGLGFIDIARKSNNWHFEFEKRYSDTLFVFKVWIKK